MRQNSYSSELFVAVVVTVPEEHFTDEDDICLAAGRFVCLRLEQHLIAQGHSVPKWIRGGCEEDFGVYFESELGEQAFDYVIQFFPSARDTPQNSMAIQYHLKSKQSWFSRLFRKQESLGTDHDLHRVMSNFGNSFESSRVLTEAQFASEY